MSVATACPAPRPRWHRQFLAMLPQIKNHASYALRHLKGEQRQDAMQETIANALVAFVALVRRGKMSIAYPTVLARYAVAQFSDGRRVGNKLNVREVLSGYAQRNKGFKVERLDQFDDVEQEWCSVLIEDRRAGPFDIVRTKLDVAAWLASLKRRERRVAEALANGEQTSTVARRYKLSAGRISQLRRELYQKWQRFVEDEPDGAAQAA